MKATHLTTDTQSGTRKLCDRRLFMPQYRSCYIPAEKINCPNCLAIAKPDYLEKLYERMEQN